MPLTTHFGLLYRGFYSGFQMTAVQIELKNIWAIHELPICFL